MCERDRGKKNKTTKKMYDFYLFIYFLLADDSDAVQKHAFSFVQ